MDCREMPKLAELNIPYYVQIYDIIYQLIQEENSKKETPFLVRIFWQIIGM